MSLIHVLCHRPPESIVTPAASAVLLVESPLVEGVTGTYFDDCHPAPQHKLGVRRGVASYALDPSTLRTSGRCRST